MAKNKQETPRKKRKPSVKRKGELGWIVPVTSAVVSVAAASANAYKSHRDSKKGRNNSDVQIETVESQESVQKREIEAQKVATVQKGKTSKWLIFFAFLVAVYGIKKATEMWKEYQKSKEATGDFKKEINPKDLKLSESEFSSIVKNLQRSLDAYDIDNKAIFFELEKLSNASEWNRVVADFGLYISTNWKFIAMNGGKFEGNLPQWINKQMSNEEKARISIMLNKIGAML